MLQRLESPSTRAVPISTLTQCTAIHGHVKVAPDGTAYVPDRNCGGKSSVIASEDGGITWNIRPVPQDEYVARLPAG